MKRIIINQLLEWKQSPIRKPLILSGARQVGKTWVLKAFGETYFEDCVYINFEASEIAKNLFDPNLDVHRIISVLEIIHGKKIIPETTLIIFDEIQVAKNGITSLKYFKENAPEYHVVAAGSLLGLSLHSEESFPVGKVDFLEIYPMSFYEYLINCNQEILAQTLQQNNWVLLQTFHEQLIQHLRTYYFLGGMPEVLSVYFQHSDYQLARTIQLSILKGYEQDFSKYAPYSIVPKIRLVWENLIGQLSKENKKFIYNQVKNGARAKEFEEAINWLVNAGLITKVTRVTTPNFPLKSYTNFDVFKLFFIDLGLLAAMGNIPVSILLEKNTIMTEFKGAFSEQFILQSLQTISGLDIAYWTTEVGTAEIDFIVQRDNEIIPIEVKAEENLQAKSLKEYILKYNPKTAIRTSLSNYREEEKFKNIPLYGLAFALSETKE
ncbi:ATP-binding protein [Fluviicola taffensis]|uniref:Putative ATPase n=1 Tax=Fluviicola taffensis (strain DSM 16823 / NCIMB 13979 / RW262) TaxID=755732 RepID=F2IF71_FLUTR|nr:ATP-binding protein [Fluviicola taffensis]AEA43545.1 putative ATPase [Fluviicola taffensis DSM 16823]